MCSEAEPSQLLRVRLIALLVDILLKAPTLQYVTIFEGYSEESKSPSATTHKSLNFEPLNNNY